MNVIKENFKVDTQGLLFNYIPLSVSLNIEGQVLQQLIDEDRALIVDNHFVLLPHGIVASLPEEERDALNLPAPYPFNIEIRASGNLGSTDFRYIYVFVDGVGNVFSNVERTGTYLKIGSEQIYLLIGDQYLLIDVIDVFNNRSQNPTRRQNIIKDNLLNFAKVKGLAKETGTALDMYLNEEQVIVPTKIRIKMRPIDKDTLEIEPIFCETCENQGGQELNQILDENEQENFIKVFDRFSSVRDIYPIPEGPRVVLSEPLKNSLKHVKGRRRVSGKEKDFLLSNPEQFFDPDLVDLDHFSERVIEIGEYKPRVFPFLRPAKDPWLPPEEGIFIGEQYLFLKHEEITKLKEKVTKALEKGENEIVWKDKQIRTDKEVLEALENLDELIPKPQMSSKDTLENLKKSNQIKNVLIIKDNFDESKYNAPLQIRSGEYFVPNTLRPDIKLLPHQLEGLKWLQGLWIKGTKGALLADDMGLGKTLQCLSFMAWAAEIQKDKLPHKPMLIVAPVVLIENWKREYKQFFNAQPMGNIVELHGSGLKTFKVYSAKEIFDAEKEIDFEEKDDIEKAISSGRGLLLNHKLIQNAGIVLTTYETLRDYQFSFGLVEWAVMALDESQKIKTPGAMVTLAVKAMKYDFGICLTGTPVENSLVDLWSIMDFVSPASLGTLKEFIHKYQTPLSKHETNRQLLGRQLKEEINDLMIRRLKENHLKGLPDKTIKKYSVEMPEEQIKAYLEVVRKAKSNLPDPITGKRKQYIFDTIAKLKDVSLHPYLIFSSDHGLNELPVDQILKASARLKKTIEILEDIYENGEKAIVFVVSRKMQRVLQRIITYKFKIFCSVINGEVTGGRRQQLINDFQDVQGFNIIIMSPEAAGVGLNVTAANHVIHLSRPWNPAKEDQSTDRVYRIGQKFGEDMLDIESSLTEASTDLTEDYLDRLTPELFEKSIALLHKNKGFKVELTPRTRDFGADVIAIHPGGEHNSLLIQCKHTSNPTSAIGPSGVQEIISAKSIYGKIHNCDFRILVITNALDFTPVAKEIAEVNGVELVARKCLIDMLNLAKVKLDDLFLI